jgi:hypothetical protein
MINIFIIKRFKHKFIILLKMGLSFSKTNQSILNNTVNYACPECQKTGKLPNSSGRFYIINETQCQCNGCGSVFPKSQFYKDVSEGIVDK